jgi:hypothetical protein
VARKLCKHVDLAILHLFTRTIADTFSFGTIFHLICELEAPESNKTAVHALHEPVVEFVDGMTTCKLL